MTDSPLNEETRQAIEKIPGDDGWWRPDGHDTYTALAVELVGYGVSQSHAVGVLTAAYRAAAEEFGD